MTRIPRAPLIGLVLLGLAVALAVLVLGQGGARPAAAQPAESDVAVHIVGIADATGDPPTLRVAVGPGAEDVDIVKRVSYTHLPPVGQIIHYQWFPPPGTTWHCDRSKVPLEQGEDVECTVSALAPGSAEGPATSQADCDALPVPFVFDPELSKCKRVVPDSTMVVAGPPTAPDIINTCVISEGPGGQPAPYVISDCDLDYELYLPSGVPPTGDPVDQTQPWNLVAQDTDVGKYVITETVRIDPEPPTTDPNPTNNESEITYVIVVPNYKCYTIAGDAPGVAPVKLVTQFGTHPGIVVGTPALVCLPVGINGQPIPGPEVPHLKCYNIVGPESDRAFNLTTRFGVETGVAVGHAKLLCVPATKTIVPDPPGSEPSPMLPHYECFDIVGSDPPDEVGLETQFGPESDVAVGQATKLCAPALKNGEGDPSAPHLKCYSITGSAPEPPKEVNLTTQFGVEANVTVLAPSLLCVPAIKEVTGVGGIAELPPLAGTSAEEAGAPAEGSGWSSASYAALAAGLAAAAVVLSAGAWYARRRWLR
jgi:hypothetical protein